MIFCAIASARGIKLGGRHGFVHQPDAMRFLGGNHFSGQHQLHGDALCQPGAAAAAVPP